MSKENDGHRARLRERMMKEGLASFQDHEVLELLLFQSVPRKDTNKLAHKLLNEFGSIAGVLNARPDQLMSVKGIGEVCACNLAMLKEVWLRYRRSEAERMTLDGIDSIVKYSEMLICESYTERLVVVYLDNASRYLYRDVFQSESTQRLVVDNTRIITSAIRTGAVGVMLFHCHVRGVCRPSASDMAFTEHLMFALANIDVVLLEHIIFNGTDDYYSLYLKGDIRRLQEKFKDILV